MIPGRSYSARKHCRTTSSDSWGYAGRTNRRTAARGKQNPKALALYVQGRALLEGWDIHGNAQRAAEVLGQALEIDDDFAEAHAAMAMALWRQYERSSTPRWWKELWPRLSAR